MAYPQPTFSSIELGRSRLPEAEHMRSSFLQRLEAVLWTVLALALPMFQHVGQLSVQVGGPKNWPQELDLLLQHAEATRALLAA